jgi:hydrogenase maturation factor
MGPAGALARRQRWAVLSSYRMMTVTVNAADPTGLPDPSGPADGGSAIWDDVHREQARQLAKKPGGGFFPYSAVRVAEADSAPTLLTATQTVGGENPHFSRVTRKTHPRMIPWYLSGAAVIAADNVWRPLPLIESGRVSADWQQMGWGGFVVDGDAIRTECDERGMGLLLYTKERFGNAQIRVVYKTKDAKSNSGVFIRLDDGVLARVGDKSPPVRREPNGKLSKAMLDILKESSEKELGAWYPVHHGYEVQICDTADARHRTGAIYSLAEAAPSPPAPADGWRTLIVTLDGERVLVDLDGQRLSTWDAQTVSRSQRHWTEPKLDAKRPTVGYIGLQNHDPGDVVWFREISVRPLASSP